MYNVPLILNSSVELALKSGRPVLALESTILAHGMPYPENLDFAVSVESEAKSHGATPATIAIIDGNVHIGLSLSQLKLICSGENIFKLSQRDLGWAVSKNMSGATTVSSTMQLANQAGIQVFSTGGIGGVHRNAEITGDISQDLIALKKIPMIVVSSGAKAILDLPKTLETLETLGVPVRGYKTNEFPAFYSRKSGLTLGTSVESPKEVVDWFRAHTGLGLLSSLLVANPIPKNHEISLKKMEYYISKAVQAAESLNITGKNLTPFLLREISKLTEGRSFEANRALAFHNVVEGSKIAVTLSEQN